MNTGITIHRIDEFTGRSSPSPSAAKSRLLAWAEDHDARKIEARSGLGTIAAGGGLAILTGLLAARVLTSRGPTGPDATRATQSKRHVIPWDRLVQAGVWLVPLVVQATHKTAKPDPAH